MRVCASRGLAPWPRGSPTGARQEVLNTTPRHVAAMAVHDATSEDDGGREWQSLPASLFDDSPLVSSACELFTLPIGKSTQITVVPQRSLFDRTTASDGAAGTGADVARMTGALLWDSAVVLASYVVRNRHSLLRALPAEAPCCLELGAGLGLTGLAAAAALGVPTTLTDRAECLPLLHHGVATNSLPLARVAALEWGDADGAHALGTFGLVLASDCVYECEHAPMFIATLAATLHPRGVALLAWDEAIGHPAALDAFRACAAGMFEWDETLDAAARDEDIEEEPPSFGKGGVRLARLRRL